MFKNLKEFKKSGYSQKSIFGIANECSKIYDYNPEGSCDNLVSIVEDESKIEGTVIFQDYNDFRKKEDGSIIVDENSDVLINVDKTLAFDDASFTIAHEIGHYVIHSKFGKHPGYAYKFPIVQEDNVLEYEANWFALGFLMPTSLFTKFVEDFCGDIDIKTKIALISTKFNVSTLIAEKRLDVYSSNRY